MLNRVCALLILVSAISLGVVADSVELTMWDLPVAGMFPAGIALDDGLLYTAASGGMEVYRLDPIANVFRSWGVGEDPQDVVVVDGIPFCTTRAGGSIVYFHPDSLGVTTASIAFPDVSVGEIHRGLDTADGRPVFWIAETEVHGILRFEHDPAFAPGVVGTPSDGSVDPRQETVDSNVVEVGHETYFYDTSLIPEPQPIEVAASSPPYTEWRLPLEDEHWVTDLAVAHDGTLWISAGLPFLFKFDPEAGTFQWLETIQNVQIFQGLLPAPDGSIWFGNIVEGSIGHFHPTTGLSEVWRIPGTVEVYDLAFDADGNIWYADRLGDAIGRLSPAESSAAVYPLPEGSEPLYLIVDDAGDVWFSAGAGNSLGRLRLTP